MADNELRRLIKRPVAPAPPESPPPGVAIRAGAAARARKPPLARALAPPIHDPPSRPLRVYAFDPLAATNLETLSINEASLAVRWEALAPGPVGEYLEVIDVDPPSGLAYAPIDLNHPSLLAQKGLTPTEGNPQFHQQMVYAVAMKTIEHFERALGRVALWAPRRAVIDGRFTSRYVQRLRIYPHALREANAFYSPEKMALLFGYFNVSRENVGDNLPGGLVFACLSHDIVAHETTHALLDGLHPRFKEPTNRDMLAFHEAFADIVALFQHFTLPEALRDQIAKARGDLGIAELLGGLAMQFGQAIGNRKALRSAIGKRPNANDYASATEAHDLGAVLVAAVFDAFLQIYGRNTRDLFRLATGGTGILPEGAIPHDLVGRLAEEAARIAGRVLNICIRALDYCPPVDLTFGEYLRALITADRRMVPDDKSAYRVAFISAFRARGIYPADVTNLSVETLAWQHPDVKFPQLRHAFRELSLGWNHEDRHLAFLSSNTDAAVLHRHLIDGKVDFSALGLINTMEVRPAVIDGVSGTVSKIEMQARPARRVDPDNTIHTDIVIEMTQSWTPDAPEVPKKDRARYRGGCTLICDFDTGEVCYVIRKRVGHKERVEAQSNFGIELMENSLLSNYFDRREHRNEPFAVLHRWI